MRLDLRRIGSIRQADQVIGGRIRCRVVKNKVAAPFKVTEFEIMHEEGIAKASNIVDAAIQLGLIQKSGAWFSFEGEKIGQGKEQALKFFKENPKLLDRIEKQARNTLV